MQKNQLVAEFFKKDRISTFVEKEGDFYYVYAVIISKSKRQFSRSEQLIGAFPRQDLAEDFAEDFIN